MSSVLVLGESHSGKTVFGAQLFGRLRHTQAALELIRQPDDILLLKHAFESLQMGQTPKHTSSRTNGVLRFPLRLRKDGSEHQVVWPDYGGEQFQKILISRLLEPLWVERVKEASGVLLLIRPSRTRINPDMLQRPREVSGAGYETSEEAEPSILPVDSQYVETLQLLQHLRGSSRQSRCRWPLVVLLTCWDEMENTELIPVGLLQKNFPLLHQYLQGAWAPDHFQVMGLSALGRSLQGKDPNDGERWKPAEAETEIFDEAFIDLTPQKMGYLVQDGEKPSDLTLPLAWLMEKIQHAL